MQKYKQLLLVSYFNTLTKNNSCTSVPFILHRKLISRDIVPYNFTMDKLANVIDFTSIHFLTSFTFRRQFDRIGKNQTAVYFKITSSSLTSTKSQWIPNFNTQFLAH